MHCGGRGEEMVEDGFCHGVCGMWDLWYVTGWISGIWMVGGMAYRCGL